ncbi:unnamed protein product [Lactuca virosa]|uniref:Uncharacterized protein n=1 Tax=Lactuca virosa TaxID=75947 RepID=A0AAU9PRN4_9ASTR|nr:unnamed protein product [Lactuca virosa]
MKEAHRFISKISITCRGKRRKGLQSIAYIRKTRKSTALLPPVSCGLCAMEVESSNFPVTTVCKEETIFFDLSLIYLSIFTKYLRFGASKNSRWSEEVGITVIDNNRRRRCEWIYVSCRKGKRLLLLFVVDVGQYLFRLYVLSYY